ncbi:hypothetical protein ACQP06_06545 [Nocardia sp. CA-136227]|uniref:hypothetical protein n=1 Tax=Nocardia sp. CA-136227 TaxID=3239979 RepID=UPI003D99FD3A
MDFSSIFVSEALGTGILILFGAGVVANVVLGKSKGFDGGWLLISFGWGIAVFAGVYAAYIAYKPHFDEEPDEGRKRDLGPRIAYALLPTRHSAHAVPERIPAGVSASGAARRVVEDSPGDPVTSNVKSADWSYAWVPVLGPLVGGALAGLVAQLYL